MEPTLKTIQAMYDRIMDEKKVNFLNTLTLLGWTEVVEWVQDRGMPKMLIVNTELYKKINPILGSYLNVLSHGWLDKADNQVIFSWEERMPDIKSSGRIAEDVTKITIYK